MRLRKLRVQARALVEAERFQGSWSLRAEPKISGVAKHQRNGGWTFGLQFDGHAKHPFVTYTQVSWIYGAFLVDAKSLALMLGYRF